MTLKKRLLLSSLLFLAGVTGCAVAFLKSHTFAQIVKQLIVKAIPSQLGIRSQIETVELELFPPALHIHNPAIALDAENILKLPASTQLKAQGVHIYFEPIQSLSGNIKIKAIEIDGADLTFFLDTLGKKKTQASLHKWQFDWKNHLLLSIERITFRLSKLSIHTAENHFFGRCENLDLLQSDPTPEEQHLLRIVNHQAHGTSGYRISAQFLDPNFENTHVKIAGVGAQYISQVDAFFSSQGVVFHDVQLTTPLLKFQASGAGLGDIFVPDQLDWKLTTDISVNAQNLKDILKTPQNPFGLGPFNTQRLEGKFFVKTEFLGDFSEGGKNIHVDAHLAIDHFKFEQLQAQTLSAEVFWKPDTHTLFIPEIRIHHPLSPRIPPFIPGQGGLIVGKNINLQLQPHSNKTTVTGLLELARVHSHWLGSAALNTLYALDTRISGKVTFEAQFHRDNFEFAKIDCNLGLEDFKLDNQKWKFHRLMQGIFSIPLIDVRGLAELSPQGLDLKKITLSLPHSQIATQGKIAFTGKKAGFDLQSSGMVDFSDIGTIAETPIQGTGSVVIKTSGPFDDIKVNICSNARALQFAKLNLGSAQVCLTYEDKNDALIIHPSLLSEGQAESATPTTVSEASPFNCKLDGFLNFHKGQEQIQLNIQATQTSIYRTFQVFANFLQDQMWFPSNASLLDGATDIEAKITGGLLFEQWKITAKAVAKEWSFLGETLEDIKAQASYDRGRYSLDSFYAKKAQAEIKADLVYEKDKAFLWHLDSSPILLSRLNLSISRDLPVKGTLTFHSFGQREGSFTSSTTKIDLENVRLQRLREITLPDSHILLSQLHDQLDLKATLFGPQASVNARILLSPEKISQFHSHFENFDLTPFLLIIKPELIEDPKFQANISASLGLQVQWGNWDTFTGALSLASFQLAKKTNTLELETPVQTIIEQSRFQLSKAVLKSKSTKTSRLIISAQNEPGLLSGKIRGEMDPGILEFFVPHLAAASGTAKVTGTLTGSFLDPQIALNATISQGRIKMDFLENSAENLSLLAKVEQNKIQLQDIQGTLGSGSIKGKGKMTLSLSSPSLISFKLGLVDSKLKIFPFQTAKFNGNLVFQNSPDAALNTSGYTLSGSLNAASGVIREKFLNASQPNNNSKKASAYEPQEISRGNLQTKAVKLNLDLSLDSDNVIQNDLFKDANFRGDLKISNTVTAPGIVGQVEVSRGRLVFKDHSFTIQNAVVDFQSPDRIKAIVKLNAISQIGNYKIQIFASGPAEANKIKIELSSNPSLAENDILSLLTTGFTADQAKRFNANDVAFVQQGEAASLLLHSLDFNRDIEDTTGFTLRVDQSVNPQIGASAFRPQSQIDAATSPQIQVQRLLLPDLTLSAGSTIGVGTSQGFQATLDYLINSGLSITGVYNNYSGNNNSSTQDVQPYIDSYGLDLKFKKRFR